MVTLGKNEPFENMVGKGENVGSLSHVSMIEIQVTLELPTANSFKLYEPKFLLSGTRLNDPEEEKSGHQCFTNTSCLTMFSTLYGTYSSF